ncbi:hypothetical protein C7974DRAFT_456995 [Boeremia exigua]|uniref:uncharacterized protein n=1 Tax=Boeremia exigua TaxID=749465 RepID=UPI001E8DCB0C|nr:uncharacterized protein C7974DRAFT_456995 [Boeremia exigua]KAH6622089.1 hypothetical protein C7974DRAFT_456995 [Boeremia exigua]
MQTGRRCLSCDVEDWELGRLGRSGEHGSEVEAVGYLTCAESDMKQPSDSLAGASRRPLARDRWAPPDRRWRAERACAGYCARRGPCLHKRTLGKVRWMGAGRAAAINKRGTKRPTSKTQQEGKAAAGAPERESAATAARKSKGAGQWPSPASQLFAHGRPTRRLSVAKCASMCPFACSIKLPQQRGSQQTRSWLRLHSAPATLLRERRLAANDATAARQRGLLHSLSCRSSGPLRAGYETDKARCGHATVAAAAAPPTSLTSRCHGLEEGQGHRRKSIPEITNYISAPPEQCSRLLPDVAREMREHRDRGSHQSREPL